MYPNRSNLEDHSYAALAFAASLPFCGKPSALPKSTFPLQVLDLRFLSLTFPFQHALSRGPRRRIARKPAIPRFAKRTSLPGQLIRGGTGGSIAGVYTLSIFELRQSPIVSPSLSDSVVGESFVPRAVELRSTFPSQPIAMTTLDLNFESNTRAPSKKTRVQWSIRGCSVRLRSGISYLDFISFRKAPPFRIFRQISLSKPGNFSLPQIPRRSSIASNH